MSPMVHPSLAFSSRRVLLAACALAWTAAACSAGDGGQHHDAASFDTEASADDASRWDAQAPADTFGLDAHAPPAPRCSAGDRTEWSGAIPNTTIAVAVCSACGKSYVVAANGSASDGQVSVDNGSMSVMTNVPAGGMATSAQITDNPSDGTVTVCGGTSGPHGCLPVSPTNQKYCNPFRATAHLAPERIDQGVDYAGSGPIYALGPGTINVYHNRDDTGWPGGTFVSYRLTAGPAAGKDIFLAENIDLDPSLHLGSFVYSGTVLGNLVNASPDCEIGWGVVGGGYTAEHSCYVEGCTTPLGINFNQLLTCLHAPSGINNGGTCCPASSGYPSDWCTLLSDWQ